jgi:predicted transcriptional regulator
MIDATKQRSAAPTEWLEAIAEGEADLAAGRVVPGDAIMHELRESLARLEARSEEPTPPEAPGPR